MDDHIDLVLLEDAFQIFFSVDIIDDYFIDKIIYSLCIGKRPFKEDQLII